MHTRLGREKPVSVVADDAERCALDARFVARLDVDDFPLEAATFDPAHVHPQQHLGPVLRLRPTGPRVDGDDGVLAIHVAAEHRADLAGLNIAREHVDGPLEIRRDVLALSRPVDENGDVVLLLAQRLRQDAVVIQPAPTLQRLLRRGGILPEVRGRNLRLELGQFANEFGFVKAPSEDLRSAMRGRYRS
jgi:hypothetical protein